MKQSEKLIDKIKKDGIKPIPKWYFSTKNKLIWFVFVIFVFIGAAAFSVILYTIQQTDFNLIAHFSHSRLELFLGLLPFFWIIMLIIFLVAAMVVIQKSKKGYKYIKSGLVGYSAAFSILIGTLFFIGGGGQWIENTFAERVTLYKGIEEKKLKIWMNPTEGYLSGIIESVNEEESKIEIIDFSDNKWIVSYGDVFIPPAIFLEKGERIKFVGQITGKRAFKAEEVRPWGGEGHREKMIKRHSDDFNRWKKEK